MTFEISVKPPHYLKLQGETIPGHIEKAFKQHIGKGLFALAALENDNKLSRTGKFWRDFSKQYMIHRCQLPQTGDDRLKAVPPIQEDALQEIIDNAPDMAGGEYLTTELLNYLWHEIDQWMRTTISESKLDLRAFLKKYASNWHQSGRVFFHLAENPNDPEYPFAFMATYVAESSDIGKTKHKPLSLALQEYHGAKNKQGLINLLSPINLASEACPLVKELVESDKIYQPQAWTPKEAYQFIRKVPVYERCGVLVRLPDWWKKRPKPQVSVTITSKERSKLSMNTLLEFDVNLVIGNRKLSKEEWQQILNQQDNLVLLKGQWIEVNTEKLTQVLDHWKTIEHAHAQEGLSFIEGMRLLAGAPSDLRPSDLSDEKEWSFVQAGTHLKRTLEKLSAPEETTATTLNKHLKATLRPYQKIGVSWLYQLTQLGLGACLADDMGLGKTVQIIALLLLLKKQKETGPSLLVLPTSLLNNWKSEIEKFAPSLNCLFVHSSGFTKAELQHLHQQVEGQDLVLTTYGMLLRQSWLQEIEWQLVILDEAQAIKNPNTKQTRLTKSLQAKSKIALTGTPVENRLSDLWSLFDFICPGLLGGLTQFKGFVKTLEEKEDNQYAPLRKLVQPYILRRLKTDKSIISDLPDKTEINVFCDLSTKQTALYNKTVKELAGLIEKSEGIQRRGLVLAYLTRFKQICNHPSQLLDDSEYKPADSGKYERLKAICDVIAEKQEKVLIFTQYREITQPLANYLADIFGHTGLVLHGGTSVKQRKKLVDLFQNDEGPSFFILSIKAGGTGLNLTKASHVIHFDRWWNPAVENQATDRSYRIGQKKNVLVHKFVSTGTVEEKVDALINEKQSLSDELLSEGGEKLLTELSNDELINLVSLDVRQALEEL